MAVTEELPASAQVWLSGAGLLGPTAFPHCSKSLPPWTQAFLLLNPRLDLAPSSRPSLSAPSLPADTLCSPWGVWSL